MRTASWTAGILGTAIGVCTAAGAGGSASPVSVERFLPAGFARDGSVSYQAEIQAALDAAAGVDGGAVLDFPAMDYAVDENGWRLHPGLTLRLAGARFRLSAACEADGAVFHGENVTDVTLSGGSIIGRNGAWKDGVNIRGIRITGASARIRIRGMRFLDLSSNGIGVFGAEDQPIRDVWIENAVVENCCKRYPDYLSGEKGEPGSVREDQGDIALYHVEDFTVSGCRLERSRSDGTHFYRCRNGQIAGNRIYRAKMGGYFLETCENVIGRGNIMLENGSRGVTIERGSHDCVFSGNVVRSSGREGLWAPDCVGLVVSGNIFDRNGRKPNGPEPRHIWNASITINEASRDPSESPVRDYLITGNLIRSTASQIAAIRVDATKDTRNIVIQNNVLLGDNRKILVEGPQQSEIRVKDNAEGGDSG